VAQHKKLKLFLNKLKKEGCFYTVAGASFRAKVLLETIFKTIA